MPYRVTCANPRCGKVSRVADDHLGKRARCPACSAELLIGGRTTTHADGSPLGYTLDDSDPPAAGGPPAHSPPPPPPVPAPADPPPPAGDAGQLGRFVIRARLGAGAFGSVYRAYDPQLDREVALKVPHDAVLSNPARVERFFREARAAAGLRHPNVVPVFDSGRADGKCFIASAYIAGRPLDEAVGERGIDPRRAAEVVRRAAEGLAYAHARGVVHRDVKPANLILDEADNPLVADFGLAARADDGSRLTADGAVMGTPAYMAPEQAAGKTAEVGPAADQYALGVTLYELLTGRVPFAGPPAVVIHNQVHTPPEPPGKHRKGLPRDLETICLKAMAKRPADRYPGCQDLADDLRRWLEGEPIRARRLGLAERAARWARREPKLAAAGGVIVALLVAIGVLLTVRNAQLFERVVLAEQALAGGREEPPAPPPDGDRDADRLALALAKAGGDDAGAAKALAEVPPDRRDLDWGFVAMRVRRAPDYGRVLNRLPGAAGGMSALTFPGPGGRLLGLGDDRTLTLWDVWTGAARPVGKLAGKLPPPRPRGPGGDGLVGEPLVLVSGDGGRVVVVRPAGGPTGQDGKEPPLTITVTAFDVASGEQIRTWTVDGFWPAAAVNTDGSRVALAYATAGRPHRLGVWDVATGERLAALDQELAPIPLQAAVLAFSPDGAAVAATTARTDRGEVRAWAVPGGDEVITAPDTGLVAELVFSPDGTRLAVVGGAEVMRYTGELRAWQEMVPVTKQGTRTVEAEVPTKERVRKTLKTADGKDCQVEYEETTYKTGRRTETFMYTTNEPRFAARPGPWLAPRVMAEKRTTTVYKVVTRKARAAEKVPVTRAGKRLVDGREEPCSCPDEATVYVEKEVPTTFADTAEVEFYSRPGAERVRVWDRGGVAPSFEVDEPAPVEAVAWRGDGRRLATATAGPSLKSAACDSPDPTECAADRPTATVLKVWDSRTARLVNVLDRDGRVGVSCLAWSPDGLHVAAGFRDRPEVVCWSAASRELVDTRFEHPGPVFDLAWSPDGKVLASYGKCSPLYRLWDGDTGAPLRTVGPAHPFARLPAGRFLLAGFPSPDPFPVTHWPPRPMVWDRESGGPVGWPGFTIDTAGGASASTRVVGTAGGPGRPAPPREVRDAATGAVVSTLEGSGGGFSGWALTPDGRHVLAHKPRGEGIVGPPAGDLRVWDAATGKPAFRRENVVEVAAEGGRLAVVVTEPRPQLLVLNPADGSEAGSPIGLGAAEAAGTHGLRFLGRDRLLAEGLGTVRVYDLAAGRPVFEERSPLGQWAASPDGKWVAVLTGTAEAPRPPTGAAPVEQTVMTEGKVLLFDTATGDKVREVRVQARYVADLQFSPDGVLLAYAGHTGPDLAAGVVDVFAVGTGARVASFRGHHRTVVRVAFRPDGKVLASGGSDRTVRLWRVPAPDAEPLPDEPDVPSAPPAPSAAPIVVPATPPAVMPAVTPAPPATGAAPPVPPPPAENPLPDDPGKRSAVLLLRAGCQVRVQLRPVQEVEVTREDDLPPGDWKLTSVSSQPGCRLTDDLAAQLALDSVTFLSVTDGPLTDAGLAAFKPLSRLRSLNLYGKRFTTDGLKTLRIGPELSSFAFYGWEKMSDELAAALPPLPRLRSVGLSGTGFGDAGLKALLDKYPTIEWVQLQDVGVTRVGCRSLVRHRRLELLGLTNMGPGVDDLVREVATRPTLKTLHLDRAELTDAGLKPLAGMKALKRVSLSGTRVSDAAVDELRKARPDLAIQR